MGWWANKLKTVLKDVKIVDIVSDESDYEEYIGILVERPDGKQKIVWLLSDEEGNGAGRFSVADVEREGLKWFGEEEDDE